MIGILNIMSGKVEDFNEIPFPDVVNIRNIAKVSEDLISAFGENSNVKINLDECKEIDISGIQLIESARIFARTRGCRLELASPVAGGVADVLRRSGLVEAFRPADAGFWFHKEDL